MPSDPWIWIARDDTSISTLGIAIFTPAMSARTLR
jgi:hypothetical protein